MSTIEVGQPDGMQPDGFQPGGDPAPTPDTVYVPQHRTIVVGSVVCGTPRRVRGWPQAQMPGEPSRFRVDFLAEVEKRWERRMYAAGERIRAGGADALCTNPGFPGLLEPRWSQVTGTIVNDGTCIWVIQPPTSDSLVAVSGITWALPTGITLLASSQKDGTTDTSAVPVGGVSGKQYTITIQVRFAGGEGFDQPCVLTVE